MVIRSPYGGGIFGGQTHSQSPEAFFAHMPGIKTVIPSNPYDAKGLLIAAIEDPDPVVFFEPKRIYNGPFDGFYERPVTPWAKHPAAEVPEGHYTVPLGKAAVAREGEAVTVLAYGTMVHVAHRHRRGGRDRRRGDRPSHHRAGRHRDDRGIGEEDRPLRRRSTRRRAPPASAPSSPPGAGALLLPSRGAGGARHRLRHALSAFDGMDLFPGPGAARPGAARPL